MRHAMHCGQAICVGPGRGTFSHACLVLTPYKHVYISLITDHSGKRGAISDCHQGGHWSEYGLNPNVLMTDTICGSTTVVVPNQQWLPNTDCIV